jgi:hypothetical protein
MRGPKITWKLKPHKKGKKMTKIMLGGQELDPKNIKSIDIGRGVVIEFEEAKKKRDESCPLKRRLPV